MCNYTPTLKVEKGLIKYPSTVLFSPPHVLVLPALLQFPPPTSPWDTRPYTLQNPRLLIFQDTSLI